jgi:hypothetical protein
MFCAEKYEKPVFVIFDFKNKSLGNETGEVVVVENSYCCVEENTIRPASGR